MLTIPDLAFTVALIFGLVAGLIGLSYFLSFVFGSSAESVGTNPLKTEFESANDFIFERKHQGWKSLSV